MCNWEIIALAMALDQTHNIGDDRVTSVAAGRVLSSCVGAKHAAGLPYARLWEINCEAEQDRAVNSFFIGEQVAPFLRTKSTILRTAAVRVFTTILRFIYNVDFEWHF